jgi:hypothetical protein
VSTPAGAGDSLEFGPKPGAWARELLLPVGAGVAILTLYAVVEFLGSGDSFVLWFFPLVAIPFLLPRIRATRDLLRNRIILTDSELVAVHPDASVRFAWPDILAVRLDEDGTAAILRVGTAKGDWALPIGCLDTQHLWREVQRRVPPSALDPDAGYRLPSYQRKVNRMKELASEQAPLLEIPDTLLTKVSSGGLLLVCIAGGGFAVLMGEYLWLLPCGILGSLAGSWLVSIGSTVVDASGVTRKTAFRTRRIRWNAVRRIEKSPGGGELTLAGHGGRRLVIPGSAWWPRSDRAHIEAVLEAHVHKHGIDAGVGSWLSFKGSRGVGVRGKARR